MDPTLLRYPGRIWVVAHKAAFCLAVCPAGEDVIEPYLEDRKAFMDMVLRPLQDKVETLYVLPNSAARRTPSDAIRTSR